jgi:hypothetical protein
MTPLDATLLATVTGGARKPQPVTRGARKSSTVVAPRRGCPTPSPANESAAAEWLRLHPKQATDDGNYTTADGPDPKLYDWEYINRPPCAPGALD